MVLAAGQPAGLGVDGALEKLCLTYWRPLYAYVRRRGHDVADAQDLTQEFFARLLETDFPRGLDRSKGKFRSFLLAALEHFLAKEWRRANAIKRGRGLTFVSFQTESAEQRYEPAADGSLSPERLFEREWAATLLEQAVRRVRDEFVRAGKGALFEELKRFLTGDKESTRYTELAAKLGTSEAALKMTVSRLRRRYGEVLREEIAQTVHGPHEVEEELRLLFAALSG